MLLGDPDSLFINESPFSSGHLHLQLVDLVPQFYVLRHQASAAFGVLDQVRVESLHAFHDES